jgi:hypothetical protein
MREPERKRVRMSTHHEAAFSGVATLLEAAIAHPATLRNAEMQWWSSELDTVGKQRRP